MRPIALTPETRAQIRREAARYGSVLANDALALLDELERVEAERDDALLEALVTARLVGERDALRAAADTTRRHVAIALDLVRKVTDDEYAVEAEDELETALDNLRSVGLPEVKAWWWVDEAGVYHYETGPLPEGEQTGVCLGDSTWVGLAEGKPQP